MEAQGTTEQVLLLLEAIYHRAIAEPNKFKISNEGCYEFRVQTDDDKTNDYCSVTLNKSGYFYISFRGKQDRWDSTYVQYQTSKWPWKDKEVKAWIKKYQAIPINHGTEHQINNRIYQQFPEVVDNALEAQLLGKKEEPDG